MKGETLSGLARKRRINKAKPLRRHGNGRITPRATGGLKRVALYDYLCAGCGPFEVSRPIGTAGPRESCSTCGRPAERTYSPPAVTSPQSALNRARETADRSAHEPRITSGPPPRTARRQRSPNPLHVKLPRP